MTRPPCLVTGLYDAVVQLVQILFMMSQSMVKCCQATEYSFLNVTCSSITADASQGSGVAHI